MKVTLAPLSTVWLVGCWTMAGGISTVMLTTAEVPARPSAEETIAVKPLLPGGRFVQMMA